MSNLVTATAPVHRRVRAFFAPVDRVAGVPTLFDPAQLASFSVDAPPAPWLDLGWCVGFARKSGTRHSALFTGAPATAAGQVRTEIEATVEVQFTRWGKLQMALASGVQQMNVLSTATGSAANASGGAAVSAVPLAAGSTASTLNVSDASSFNVGDLVVADVDYAGGAGFVGSGVSGGYVKSAAAIRSDPDYVRRVSLNVARVTGIVGAILQLGSGLLAGVPAAGMKVSRVVGFCDREGGSFFQEWSALFMLEGEQGDRVAFHYPRLQAKSGAAEMNQPLSAKPLEKMLLAGSFRALPVIDANDGEKIVCFRSYLPAALRSV